MTVSDAVRGVVASLTLDELGEARAALALRLAAVLDSGQGVMATAAISKELRETLAELTATDGADDEFNAFLRELSAPMGDAEVAR
jgi:hypothetical protein